MTVRDLIEILENYPSDLPVVNGGCEISEVAVREEIYLSEDHIYEEGKVVKVY